MSGNSTTYQEALRAGNALSWELKWEAAVERYRVAVAEFPEDPVALNSLATAFFRCGRLPESLAHYQALLKLAPDDESALARVAEIHQRQGDVSAATVAYLRLADRYVIDGQRAKAVQTWLQVGALFPDSLDTQERLYRAMSRAGETHLAGKVGLAITRLRGDKAGKGLDPWAKYDAEPARAGREEERAEAQTPLDPALRANGLELLELAREHYGGGRLQEALLGYAQATAILEKAGAFEAVEAEQSASTIAAEIGGAPFKDLVRVDQSRRRTVLESMIASRDQMDIARPLAAIDCCLAGICAAPDYLPLQERLAEGQAGSGATAAAVGHLISLGEVYILRGDRARAAEVLARAAQIGVGDREARDQLILALLRAGMSDEAVRQILAYAAELLEQGEVATAIRQLARAVQVRPDDRAVLMRYGEALEADRQFLPAVQAYEHVLRAAPGQLEAAFRLVVAASLGESYDAITAALAVILEALAEGSAKAVDLLPAFAAQVAAHPDNVSLRVCHAIVLAHSGDWLGARVDLETAASSEGLVGGIARLWLGRFWLAQDSSDGDTANALRQLAILQRQVKEKRSAERGWQWIAIESHRLWAELSTRRGELDKAAAALAEVRRVAPKDKRVCIQLAEIHFRRADPSAALTEVVALGDLHRDSGQLERALLVYQGAAQLQHSSPVPRQRLIETQLALGRVAEALATAQDLALLLAEQGKNEAGAEVLRQMIPQCKATDPAMALSLREGIARLLPGDVEARQQLISNYLANGMADNALLEAGRLWREMLAADRLGEAAKALQQALQVDPWNAEALAGMGNLYERTGEQAKAVASYRRALSADAQNVEAATRLEALINVQNTLK